jgi:hypothetical protein
MLVFVPYIHLRFESNILSPITPASIATKTHMPNTARLGKFSFITPLIITTAKTKPIIAGRIKRQAEKKARLIGATNNMNRKIAINQNIALSPFAQNQPSQ